VSAVTQDGAAPAPAPPRKWVRFLLLGVILLLAAMWVYAFVFAPRGGVNPVKDAAWTDGAKAICIATADRLEPLVFHTQVTEDNKATELPKFVANLDQGNAILSGMLDQIEALPRTSDKAKALVPLWLADYRNYVNDLRLWTDQLRTGHIAEFGVTKTETNIPVDERINTFATENHIKECRTDQLSA